MTASDCRCDEAKAWEARALKAEAELAESKTHQPVKFAAEQKLSQTHAALEKARLEFTNQRTSKAFDASQREYDEAERELLRIVINYKPSTEELDRVRAWLTSSPFDTLAPFRKSAS